MAADAHAIAVHEPHIDDRIEHLQRIRDLQARRFSLAAIRTLLETDRGASLVAQVFEGAGALTYSLGDLVERSGLDASMVVGPSFTRQAPTPSKFSSAKPSGSIF